MHTGGFVWQNVHRDEVYPLFKEYVQNDLHYSAGYYKGYRNRSWGLTAEQDYNDSQEGIRALKIRFQSEPTDYINATNLARLRADIGDSSGTRAIVRQIWRPCAGDTNALAVMLSLSMRVGDYGTAEKIYDSLIVSGRGGFRVMYDLGVLKALLKQADSSYYYFDRAFRDLAGWTP